MCSQSFVTIISYRLCFIIYYSSTVIEIELNHKRFKFSNKLLSNILFYNLQDFILQIHGVGEVNDQTQ